MSQIRLAERACLTGVILSVLAYPASADIGNPLDCKKDPTNPKCTVQVEKPGDPSNPGDPKDSNGGDGSPSNCTYARVDDTTVPAGGPLPGAWYVRICDSPNGIQSVSPAFWVTGGGPGPASLGQRAASELVLPTLVIRWNPAPPADQVLFVPTWFWVDPASWAPQSATASVPGLSVTAKATPARVQFTTGDGGSVTCDGPGTAWKSGMDPLASSPTCGYTYPKPGTYTLTATVTWTVTWAGGGANGTVDPLTTTVSQPVRVVEAGALNTNGG